MRAIAALSGRGVALAALAAVAIAGCGGSGGSARDKAFVKAANARCFARLSPVAGAVDATKTDAPRDGIVARAQVQLLTAANDLDGMNTPADKRSGQTAVSQQLVTSSRAMGKYLRDKQVNEPETSDDWNAIVAQLSQLEQVASEHDLKACTLPVE
jgi:hypothetical protein